VIALGPGRSAPASVGDTTTGDTTTGDTTTGDTTTGDTWISHLRGRIVLFFNFSRILCDPVK
jgi:hypothetical protein